MRVRNALATNLSVEIWGTTSGSAETVRSIKAYPTQDVWYTVEIIVPIVDYK